MQAKVGLTLLLRNFRFKLNSGTKMPIKLDPKNFLSSAEGDLLIDIEKINRSDL